jgi:hypothetical protein
MTSMMILYARLGRTLWHTRRWLNMLAALSFPADRKLQMWNAVLSMRQCSRLLPNFHFSFRLWTSFRGGSIFRDPPCTRTGTSRNHFASRCVHLQWIPYFWRWNRREFGSRWQSNYCRSSRCKAKHAPATRHCHLGWVMDLFVQWAWSDVDRSRRNCCW